MTMLSGYRVLDLTEERGALCGKLFADLGAEVIGVEPPGGNPARRLPPFGKGGESLFWAAYGAGRRSLVLDPERAADRKELRRLAASADVLVESFGPGYLEGLGLGYEALRRDQPELVYVSISAYGQTGPYARFRGSDLTLWSMGGHTYLCGDEDRPPVRVTAPQTWHHAASEAVVGALIALLWRDGLSANRQGQGSGRGQHVDVSAQQCVAWTLQVAQAFPQPAFGGVNKGRRMGDTSNVRVPYVFRCKDGFIAFTMRGGAIYGRNLNAAVRALDRDGFADTFALGRDWSSWDTALWPKDPATAQLEVNALDRLFSAWFRTKTMEELYDLAIAEGLMLAPAYTARELYRSPQLVAREFWRPVDLEPSSELRFPGPYVKAAAAPLAPPRPAPELGEAKEADLTPRPPSLGRKGVPRSDEMRKLGLAALSVDLTPRPPSLRGKGVPPSDASGISRRSGSTGTPDQGTPFPRREGGRGVRSALSGLKVADFSWVALAPSAARYLANYGATVVRVESRTRPDTLRLAGPFAGMQPGLDRSWWFNDVNAGKLGITLDLNRPGAREVALRLVAWADVLLESFTTGTMAKWGLDYEQLRRINPGLIMLSTTQQGQTGPHARYAGYGNLLLATAGLMNLTGWPDREPVGPFAAYPDFVVHRLAAIAILAALAHLRRTGEGQYLDLSQLEATLQFLAPYSLAFDATGEVATRAGNRDPGAAPHGVFPSAGVDRWIAIACWNDGDWQRLAELIGEPWAADPQYATFSGRKAEEDDLEARLGAWTAPREAHALMARLQAAGIDAGVVQTGADLHADPQLAHRRHYQPLDHPEIGPALYDGFAAQLSETPGALRPAPAMGQHNAQVYREILGYSDDEIADFVANGIIN
jgi:crotonobetainyl-CoA:carnitine CoA-transferase CaiB-like acyl-CoA transferase